MSKRETLQRPLWPITPVDPAHTWVDYDIPADEFLVYFAGSPVPAISHPLNAPGYWGLAIMIGLGADDEETGEIVGVQVIPMLLGAVQEQPHWAVLTWAAMAGDYGEELLRERLPGFLDEVELAFRQYWTPAPPVEEQLAQMARASRQGETASGNRERPAAHAKSA